jgi:cyclin A
MTMYLLELSRLPYKLSFVQPSLLAAAAIFLARATLGMRDKEQALDDNGYWTKTLDFYTGYCLDDIKEVVLTIHRFQLAAAEGSLLVQKIFRKYHSSEYRKVSAKTVLRVEDLGVDDIHHHDDLRTDPETNKLIL